MAMAWPQNRSSVAINDCAFIGRCWAYVDLLGIPIASPLLVGLFSQSPSIVNLHLSNAITFVPRTTLAFTMYTMMLYQSPPRWTTGAAAAGVHPWRLSICSA